MSEELDKNLVDVTRVFETYIAFNGDVARTAVACNLQIADVQQLASSEGWEQKAKAWTELREGTTADVAVQVNRAVNFVQAHRLRSLVDKVVTELGKLSPEELISRLSTVTRSGKGDDATIRETFSARPLTDLVKAAESAHLMTQRALGDTVQERPEGGDAKKGSNIALLVHAAMSAADQTGLDSTDIVKRQLSKP